ncbi:MAG: efflux RND transporter periplasmic adaptor subunit [Candidatus Zixiibacteriota bacterium]
MKKIKLLTAVILVILSLLIIASCSKEEPQETSPVEERSLAVRAFLVERSSENMFKTFTGSLEGEKQAFIYAKLAESVEKVHVTEGEQVEAEKVLVSLDKYGPSSSYTETRSLFLNSEKNFNKMEYLYKEGAISESEFDAAKTQYEVNRANFEAVSRMIDVRTPIAGTVTSINVSEGDFVNIGTELATVATTDRLRVKFGVNSEDVKYFKTGSSVIISSEVYDYRIEGRVISVAGSADPQTRAFQIEVLLDNTEKKFKPGMFVRISVVIEKLEEVILIPRKAVMILDDQPTVFVVVDSRAVGRVVNLGAEVDGYIVVSSGLNPSDTLVTLGQDYLEDGDLVKITAWDENKR